MNIHQHTLFGCMEVGSKNFPGLSSLSQELKNELSPYPPIHSLRNHRQSVLPVLEVA